MKKANLAANPPMGAPKSSNPRQGVEKTTKMMGTNDAKSHQTGAPGSSNPRTGKVVMPSVYGPGGIVGKPKTSGNPGSSNPRKGSLGKTETYTGETASYSGKRGTGSGSGNI
jgi:hypothetical protein